MIRFCTTALIALLLLTLPAAAHARAGHFLFVYGKVSVTAGDGAVRRAAKGMAIEEGETIASDPSGAAQLRMEDGAFLAIRPNTVLKIEAYAYKEKGREERSTLSLLKGTFRAITGEIGKKHPKKDLVKTPVATIGIRGTDHEPAYIPPPAPGQAPSTPPGAYDKVNKGATFMQTDAGRLDLGPNQVGHAMAPNKKPVTLPSMPAFYKTPDKPAVKVRKKSDKGGNDKGSGKSSNQQNNSSTKKRSNNTGSTLVASNANSGTVSDSSVNNEPGGGSSTGGATGTTGTTTTIASTTPTEGQNALQSYSASSGSGQALNLTQQTITNSDGSISSITTSTAPATTYTTPTTTPTASTTPAVTPTAPVITYTTPATKDVANVSYISGALPHTNMASDWWGQNIVRDSTGNVTGWFTSARFTNNPTTGYPIGTQTGAVTAGGAPSTWNANSYATTGIRYGSYNASSVDYTYSAFDPATGTTQTSNISDSLLLNGQPTPFTWITGPSTLDYLPMAYTGNASFVFDGGHAVDQTGSAATLSGNGSVNFANMSVNLSLTATTGSGKWQASTSNVPLEWGYFNDSKNGNGSLSLTYTPTGGLPIGGPLSLLAQGDTSGSIRGSLTGKGLTGIVSSFAFTATGPDYVTLIASLNGVAAYANTGGAVSPAVNHRWIAVSASTPYPTTNPYTLASPPQFQYHYPNAWVQAFANNTGSITYDAAGGITGFTAPTPLLGTGLSSAMINNVFTWIVDYYWIQTAAAKMSYAGTVRDAGTDPVTGISWGRWSGNISQTLLNSTSHTTAPPTSLHYIAGPVTNQQVQLPTSGTFSYTLAGNTSPTDATGTAGTLNSASLVADFTNMKVNVGISATVANTTLSATGNGIPITGALFHDGKGLSVTCSGTCHSHNQGEIGGTFTGATGNGAAVTYSLGTNNPTGAIAAQQGTTISGVAAFHR